jgi:hypothetical protein
LSHGEDGGILSYPANWCSPADIAWETGPLVIIGYSYEVWRGAEELYWYDSQPHPNDPTLASTDPHHKHVPPVAEHHRIPAPGLSFTAPNLLFLIREIETGLPQ